MVWVIFVGEGKKSAERLNLCWSVIHDVRRLSLLTGHRKSLMFNGIMKLTTFWGVGQKDNRKLVELSQLPLLVDILSTTKYIGKTGYAFRKYKNINE